MNANRSNRVPFTCEAFMSLSAVALAAPISEAHFLSACENAGVLGLMGEAHNLYVIEDDRLRDEFDQFLDEIYGSIRLVSAYEFSHARVLKEMDEAAYGEAFREYADSDFVEYRYSYYRRAELYRLDSAGVLDTLATHCVERLCLDEEQAAELSSADTPEAFVTALKALCLLDVAEAAPNQTEATRRRM